MTISCFRISFILFALGCSCALVGGQQPSTALPDVRPIEQAVQAYANAYNQRDAEAVAQMWSANAVYTNRFTGESIAGRDAIRDQFKSIFSENDHPMQMELSSESIQFLSPSVAVEHGVARLVASESEPSVYAYTAVYVQQDGKWLLDRVTDEEIEIQPFREGLDTLSWMAGSWEYEGEEIRVNLECHWTSNQSFLVRSFVISSQQGDFTGTQIIGWDPLTSSPRSWTFDEGGAFVEGRWSVEGDHWTLYHQGMLADGTKTAMVNVMSKVDNDSFTWKTVDRISGDELLPDLPALTFTRASIDESP